MNILVLRLSSIGDIILTTPFLRSLRRRYPDAAIDVGVFDAFAPLVAHDPAVRAVIAFDRRADMRELRRRRSDLRERGYDVVFDLHNSHRTRVLRQGVAPAVRVVRKRPWRWMFLVALKIDFFHPIVAVPDRYIDTGAEHALSGDDEGCAVMVPPEIIDRARRLATERGFMPSGNILGICPGARHFTKRWPAAHFEALTRRFLESPGNRVLVFGDQNDDAIGARLRDIAPDRVLSLCGTLSLLETAAWMDACRAVVSNDSGLMHLATARNRPVVALFGSTVPQFGFTPYHSPDSVVLQMEDLPCRPCTHIGRSRCPKGHFRCLDGITPESVMEAVARYFPRS